MPPDRPSEDVRALATLSHPTRLKIYESVRDMPGVAASDVARRLAIHLTTAQYHLRRLEALGLLTSRELRHVQRFLLPGVSFSSLPPPPSDVADAILRALRGAPGISLRELAERVECSTQLASYHVKQMRRCGCITTSRSGRRLQLHAVSKECCATGLHDGRRSAP